MSVSASKIETQPIGSGAVYVWEVEGKPVSIHISLDVVERIGVQVTEGFKAVPRRGLEIGGLLLGTIEPGDQRTVIIEDFQPVDSEHRRGPSYVLSNKDREHLEHEIAQWKSHSEKKISVIGYYRSHTRTGLYLDEEDFALIKSYFADPSSVFLLVKPQPGEASIAGFFFWEDGDVSRKAASLEFPFDRGLLETGNHRVLRPPSRNPGEEPAILPPVSRPQSNATRLRRIAADFRASRWLWITFALLLLTLGALWYRSAVRPTVNSRAESSRERRSELALNVERSGSTLRLSWDRNAPAIQHAERASLWINDGRNKRRLELDANQLKNGSVAYWPSSTDVSFRMEVFAAPHSVSESVRAISGGFEPPTPIPGVTPAVPVKPEAPSSRTSMPLETASRNIRPSASKAKPSPMRLPEPAAKSADTHAGLAVSPPPIPPAELVGRASPPPTTIDSLGPPTRKPVPVAAVTLEPVRPSGFRRAISKIPGLRVLQRHRYKAGDRFLPAKPIHQVAPTLPAQVRRGQVAENPISLKLSIDQKGRISRTELLSKAGDRQLIARAVDAASQWQFQPALLNGSPVSSSIILHFRFRTSGGPVSTSQQSAR